MGIGLGFPHRRNPPNCPSCTLFSDVFNRADVGDDYDVRSGSWATDQVSGPLDGLKNTATPALIVLADDYMVSCYSDVPRTQHLELVIDTGNISDPCTYRLIFDWLDDDNYHFVETTWDTGGGHSIRLYKRSGGTNTALSGLISPTGSEHVTTGCFAFDWLGAYGLTRSSIPGGGPYHFGKSTIWHQGTKVGIEVTSGTVFITDLIFSVTNAEDEDCSDCGRCIWAPHFPSGEATPNCEDGYGKGDNVHAGSLDVVISGLPDSDCDDTYTLPPDYSPNENDPAFETDSYLCNWRDNTDGGRIAVPANCSCVDDSNVADGKAVVIAFIGSGSGGTGRGTLVIQWIAGLPPPFLPFGDWVSAQWELPAEDWPDEMTDWSNVDIPLVAHTSSGTYCGSLGTPTCKVTAV